MPTLDRRAPSPLIIRDSRSSRDFDEPFPALPAGTTDAAAIREYVGQELARRQNFAVLEVVEFVEKPTGPSTPPPMPKPTDVRLSAGVLFGALIAAGIGAKVHPGGTDIAAGAIVAAIALFLICLWRHELAAQAAK